MKKLFFIAILALGISAFATAQTNDKAIGLRGGWGTELSYQQPLSGSTRLEVDLGLPGWKYSGIVLSGIHQWVMNIDGGLDWYAGLGGQVGSIRWDKNESSGIGLGLAGQIGIELMMVMMMIVVEGLTRTIRSVSVPLFIRFIARD